MPSRESIEEARSGPDSGGATSLDGEVNRVFFIVRPSVLFFLAILPVALHGQNAMPFAFCPCRATGKMAKKKSTEGRTIKNTRFTSPSNEVAPPESGPDLASSIDSLLGMPGSSEP